jgi:hypothetical protein
MVKRLWENRVNHMAFRRNGGCKNPVYPNVLPPAAVYPNVLPSAAAGIALAFSVFSILQL